MYFILYARIFFDGLGTELSLNFSDLKPRVASTLLPGLPAHVIFMCIRHADYINNDEKIKSFLTATINAIRRLIKKRHEDLDTSVLWLVNTCRLLHNLKQYSGEKVFFKTEFLVWLSKIACWKSC